MPFVNQVYWIKILTPEAVGNILWRNESIWVHLYVQVCFDRLLPITYFQNFIPRYSANSEYKNPLLALCGAACSVIVVFFNIFLCKWASSKPISMWCVFVFSNACAHQPRVLRGLIWIHVSSGCAVNVPWVSWTLLCWLEVRNKTYSW